MRYQLVTLITTCFRPDRLEVVKNVRQDASLRRERFPDTAPAFLFFLIDITRRIGNSGPQSTQRLASRRPRRLADVADARKHVRPFGRRRKRYSELLFSRLDTLTHAFPPQERLQRRPRIRVLPVSRFSDVDSRQYLFASGKFDIVVVVPRSIARHRRKT